MTLHKIRLGTNENGSPMYHYAQDDPAKGVVMTGPATGEVEVTDANGEKHVYDVTEPFIEVADGHEGLLSHELGLKWEKEGHPNVDTPFRHDCTTDHCGHLARAGAPSVEELTATIDPALPTPTSLASQSDSAASLVKNGDPA